MKNIVPSVPPKISGENVSNCSQLLDNVRGKLKDKLRSQSDADDLGKYLWKIDLILGDSIGALETKGLTETEIEYCVCIALGLKLSQIMLCYNIMNQTVRKNRSKIGKTMELDKEESLDIVLIDLFFFNIRR